ncbi:alpha/beta fold hydrolase [Acuticoccus sp.]|uniref:alpha/beta fold hydrolase n=1 Tax=Acuticoccus sp. TaxID=1904378 RepID=UPI003B52F16E
MATFSSDGVTLDYGDEGAGPPVLLIHGFASNGAVNWGATSWVRTVTGSGRRALVLDNRGHGNSDKLYDPADYATDRMAADVVRLLDHVGVERAALVGYSMGARIAAFATLAAPTRVAALVLSGMASALVDGTGDGEAIAAALEAPSADVVTDEVARGYRLFAERTRSDLAALAACIRASRQTLSAEEVGRIATPTLVVAGSEDRVCGSPDALAAMIPGAEPVTLAGRDHMSAVGDATHKARVLAFLDAHGA